MKTVPHIPPAWKNISDLFVALGDEHRQRILLSFEPGEQLSISDVAATMPLSRTAVTHHLKVLEIGGVLKSEKVGKEVRFYINKAHMQEALSSVLEFIDHNI